MKLHCTLVRSPGSGLQESPLELTIDAPEGTTGEDIRVRLIQRFGTGPISIQGKDIDSMSVGTAPLVNGAILVDGACHRNALKARRRMPGEDAPLALAVHTGVGAGTVVPLRRGSYTIGRSGTRIVIPDPELSREHARLVVAETDIMIIDLDSANGIHVDGKRIRNAVVSTESSIRCGNTTMSLVFVDLAAKTLADAGTSTQRPLTVPGRADTANRALLLLTAVLPLLIGIGLAVLTGLWMFLAFAAVSAVSVLVPLASERRQRRELRKAIAAAVEEDRQRRRRSGPSLALLALAVSQNQGITAVSSGEDRVWLRLGEAPQPANVKVEPAATSVGLPCLDAVPVTLDPARPTTFRGSDHVADGIIRSLLMQLAGYPRGHGTRIVICGQAGRLPLAARYLPSVTLTASAADILPILSAGFGRGYQHGVVLLLASSNAEDDRGTIAESAAALGWQVLQFSTAESAGTWDVELTERKSLLRLAAGDIAFVPDLAREDVFLSFCRQLAVHQERRDAEEPAVPEVCSLPEVLSLSPHHTAARWKASTRNHGLHVPLGLSATGVRILDLQADGPHLLVAGTTGSGKSELLRTLTLALALSHPPDRVNFLFVDFKGGAGLGPLTELVHCVGLLTDLSAHELERTLISLRAEIRLREEALAAARVPDLAAYRSSGASENFPLPHLVVVIDEFRMLVDDAPEVLRELLRIAAIGRSLGIHLVMATQRPQGALTADIRANVTSSIALRVQSEMESTDIISSKAAAGISIDAPGRAFLARGTEAPQEFQTASLAPIHNGGSRPAGAVKVELAADCLASAERGGPEGRLPAGQTPAQAAAPLVNLVRNLWCERKGRAPRLPVAPPLPSNLPAPPETTSASPPGSHGNQDWAIELGLLDLPDQQRLVPLVWNPAADGHLALIGAPSSGATEALELAVMQLLLNPVEAHCYILDAGGTFLTLATHPAIGAHAGLHELRRAVRVLERLKQELARRLGQGGGHGEVPLVLVISGWGSWVSAFRAGPLAWAEDLVQDLARDGGQAGIVVTAAGDRELVNSRALSAFPNRVYFPTGSNADSRIAWPRMPATAELKGRAVVFGPMSGEVPAVCQLYNQPRLDSRAAAGGHEGVKGVNGQEGIERVTGPESVGSSESRLSKRPFRIDRLPALVPALKIRDMTRSGLGAQDLTEPGEPPRAPGSTTLQDILIGIGGDELEPTSCRLQAAGVFTVLGGPGAGKSNFISALPLMNSEGRQWLYPKEGTDLRDFWEQSLATAAAGETSKGTVALVDDADLLPAEAIRDLSAFNALGHPVVLTATYSPMLLQRVPLIMCSRSAGTGLLLAPRSLSDGDLFGVRFEVEASAPPGRGIFISQGLARSIQVGWAAPGSEGEA
ncbi:FtsK/SpoIIIE domain-containing protein [Arthrobacter sp. Alg241-R88]|uniref:FtsK/SpoIIIE domain-containing protein n=1 Tax=Arthrobacter sp. Alg241-R88 TaxID=2305984 RepID=UPI0013D86585|nr:FtsK/SpoIIIE domain-containing protein [Arthrobacter sp. Alg241-R88]